MRCLDWECCMCRVPTVPGAMPEPHANRDSPKAGPPLGAGHGARVALTPLPLLWCLSVLFVPPGEPLLPRGAAARCAVPCRRAVPGRLSPGCRVLCHVC